MVASIEELNVSLEGGNIYCLKQGTGYPLVMLHAAEVGSWTWHKVLEPLSKYFTCYALDLPGYDRSDTPSEMYSIERFADAIREFMDKEGIETAHILGQRTGGLIAVELAISNKNRVDKLVLEGSPAWTVEEGRLVWEKWILPNLNEYGGVGPLTYDEAVKTKPDLDREWFERVADTGRRNGKWNTLTHEAAANFDMSAKSMEVDSKALLVYGEKDVMRKKERLNANLRGSRLEIVLGCNTPHYEAPEIFVELISSFLME